MEEEDGEVAAELGEGEAGGVAEGALAAGFEPDGGFLHAEEDEGDEEEGGCAEDEESAPADEVEEATEGCGGEEVADGVSLLEDAGEGSAALFGESFKGEGSADTPDAAHGDAEEGAEDEEGSEGGGEGAGELDGGVAGDVGDEDGLAAEAICERAEDEGAEGAEGEGEED